jgi:hypothetical protein
MPPKAAAAAAERPKYRKWHAIECMLCVFVSAVCALSVLILLVSILKAVDNRHSSHRHLTSRHRHISSAATARLDGERVPHEVKVLEILRDHTNEQLVAQSDWLPGVQRKRSTLDFLNPFSKSLASAAARLNAEAVHTLDLRKHARISDDTYYLGAHPHPHDSNSELHSYAFVHYTASAKSAVTDKLSNIERSEKYRHFNRSAHVDTLRHYERKSEVIECGAPIAMGARWRSSRGYYVHPQNAGGMDTNAVILAAEAAADTWRCVFRTIHQEPLGPLLGVIADSDTDANRINFQRPTGDNHIAFAKLHLPDGGEDTTLAVTVTHGVFGGPVEKRYIAEFSTLFNDAYAFADCADVAASCSEKQIIDFQSIATHELGHAHGLDDLYSGACSGQTMFWNAKPAETKKRSLSIDDRNSMIALYYDAK